MVSIDEPVELSAYDARWPTWYADDAAELRDALKGRVWEIEHFGSTAVPGMVAKPIVDILVGLTESPISAIDRDAIAACGYEYLGEAGIAGREYFRRRRGHYTNLAVVEWNGPLWRDNLAVRDYLRAHPEIAAQYADAKQQAHAAGARALLAYSDAKDGYVAALVKHATQWCGQRRGITTSEFKTGGTEAE